MPLLSPEASPRPADSGESRHHTWLVIGGFALAYLPLHLSARGYQSTDNLTHAIWPAGGMILAALLRLPRRLWPLMLALFLVTGATAEWSEGTPLPLSLGFMLAIVSESLVAAWLIVRLGGSDIRFDRLQNVRLLLFVAIVVNAFFALAGAIFLDWLRGDILGTWWLARFVANGVGLLFVTPFVLTWLTPEAWRGWRWPALLELAANLILTALITHLAFQVATTAREGLARPYMLIGIIVWAALRLGPRGVTLTGMICVAIAITSPAATLGPSVFGGEAPGERLLLIQLCMGFLGAAGLLLAASVAQTRAAENTAHEEHLRLLTLGDNLLNSFICQIEFTPGTPPRCLHVSSGVERMLGIPPDALLRGEASLEQAFLPLDRDAFLAALSVSRRLITPLNFSGRARHPGGHIRWLNISGHPRRLADGALIFDNLVLDVTARIETEAYLQRINQLLRTSGRCRQIILHATSEHELLDGFCRQIVDAGYLFAWIGYAEPDSAKTVRPVAQVGYEAGYLEKLGITWDDIPRGRGPVGTAIRSGRPSAVQDIHTDPAFALWRDEAARRGYAAVLALPLSTADHPFGALAVYSATPDVYGPTETALLGELANDLAFAITHLRAEAEHRHTLALRDRLSMAVEQSSESIIITDRDARILYVNPAFTRLTGYSRAEALGRTPSLLKSGRHDAAFFRSMWDQLARGDVWRGHLSNRTKDGRIVEEDVVISPVRDTSSAIVSYVSVQRDVTREWLIGEKLRRARKMEAVGQFAGGIAHDYNNFLAGFLIQIGVMRKHPDTPPALQQELQELESELQRASHLTRQLLTFSRRSKLEIRVLDLEDLLASLHKKLSLLAGPAISVHLLRRATPSPVAADPALLEQALVNLVLNARDAMPTGGRISLETTEVSLDAENVRLHAHARPGRFVRLSVADTGCGMDSATLGHIFDPFFTTKPLGQGTGLGLPSVHGIIAQHEGWIDVTSQPGQGTTFSIFLPASSHPLETPSHSDNTSPELHHGTETILLLEDMPHLLQKTTQLLRLLGYRVLPAANASEALNHWSTHRATIDLLLTDMFMPGPLDGLALARQLLAEKSTLRIIICSGQTSKIATSDQPLPPDILLLQKPYPMSTLSRLVRQTLNHQNSTP